MDFPKVLRQYQLERHLSNEAFAKLVGKSRTWLQSIYAKNKNVKKHTLSDMTIYSLHEKTGIPMELMYEYNVYISNTQGAQWED